MKNKKKIIWLGAMIFIAGWIGLVYLMPTIENQTIDGQYYEMEIVDKKTSHLNESFSIKISKDAVIVYKNGKRIEGKINKESKTLTFDGEKYSYVSNAHILTIASIREIQNMELEQKVFIKEGSAQYKDLKAQEKP